MLEKNGGLRSQTSLGSGGWLLLAVVEAEVLPVDCSFPIAWREEKNVSKRSKTRQWLVFRCLLVFLARPSVFISPYGLTAGTEVDVQEKGKTERRFNAEYPSSDPLWVRSSGSCPVSSSACSSTE